MALLLHAGVAAATGESDADLGELSLSALANVEVTSVSKTNESLQQAAASIFVITHDAIRASAATNVIEALRLAPNLLITQLTANSFIISARGFGGNPAAQSFANKLLVLIDGRSVYTPLYSGVYADTIDVPLEDIERIEVISGPGATLWGANAMNGVVNIITRPAFGSTGGYADLGGGNQSQFADARWGGALGQSGSGRIYALGFHRAAETLGSGQDAHDGWGKGQGGFRYDFTHDHDDVTLQGDLYRALQDTPSGQDGLLVGSNLLARYQRHEEISDFKAQVYFDQNERVGPAGQGAFVVHTYDLELQEALVLGSHHLVFGGGERLNSYGITSTSTLIFAPEHRNLTLGNAFIEDTLTLSPRLNLSAGLKLEDDPFAGFSPLPDLRMTWMPSSQVTLWAAASRAIRSPTPFDTDVQERIGPMLGLHGIADFRPETLIAYQAGIRAQPLAPLSLSLTAFDHHYDQLRTIEPVAPDAFFPLHWDNLLKAHTRGLELWATWQVQDWWSLSPGVAWQHEDFTFKPGSSALLGPSESTDDPSVHANLESIMQLSNRWRLYASFRYVGALPAPRLGALVDADARLGRTLGEHWEVSVAGSNLLHREQVQFAAPSGERIYRSIAAELRWRH